MIAKSRAKVILGAAIYIAIFNVAYVAVLSKTYGYYGFKYVPVSWELVALEVAYALVPAVVGPISLRRTSQMFYWVLYVIVFVPSLFVPLFSPLQPLRHVLELSTILTL